MNLRNYIPNIRDYLFFHYPFVLSRLIRSKDRSFNLSCEKTRTFEANNPKRAIRDFTYGYISWKILLYLYQMAHPLRKICSLDIGGGLGCYAFMGRALGVEAYCIDNTPILKEKRRGLWHFNGLCFSGDYTSRCDIINNNNKKFDLITAFDVFEHFNLLDTEGNLCQETWIRNLSNMLDDNGMFIAAINSSQDPGYHHTVKKYRWWVEVFEKFGFHVYCLLEKENLFSILFPRKLGLNYYETADDYGGTFGVIGFKRKNQLKKIISSKLIPAKVSGF